jgi:hypothetical protein
MNDDAIKYGILKCRDLVEIYYGARMVVSTREHLIFPADSTPFELLKPDPSRIGYEIILSNEDVTVQQALIGSQTPVQNNDAPSYSINAGDTMQIKRGFLDDLDSVTEAVWAQATSENLTIGIRETFLTPAPVDEVP